MSYSWIKTIITVGVSVLIGIAIGWIFHGVDPSDYKGGALRQSGNTFTYISPLLACDVGSQEAFPEFASIKAELTSLINKKVSAGDVQNVSVYLRSLRSGRWLEINPSETYAPASLLKVFVMLAYFKEADITDNPNLLNKQIIFEGSKDVSKNTPGEEIPHLIDGKSYTVEQVINQMIRYSDNDALNTLVDNFDSKTVTVFQDIFTDLSLPSPVTQSESSLNFLTIANYSLVFRVLYGSTYLSTRYSEKSLALMAEAQYKNGIVAGVPSTIAVAHKFGVITIPATATSSAINELHDCGIVYYPNNHPYLLCVMTKGSDFSKLQQTLKDMSTVTYVWLDNYFKNLPVSPASTTVITR